MEKSIQQDILRARILCFQINQRFHFSFFPSNISEKAYSTIYRAGINKSNFFRVPCHYRFYRLSTCVVCNIQSKITDSDSTSILNCLIVCLALSILISLYSKNGAINPLYVVKENYCYEIRRL